MRKIVITIVLLFLHSYVYADTHYVSTHGSDTYPYNTWATAADSIQKGIKAASSGDTVRVGAGTYWETIHMTPGIILLGAGLDSCFIKSLPSSVRDMVYGADSAIIEGFCIIGWQPGWDKYCVGIRSAVDSKLKRIANNKLSNFNEGIYFNDANVEISNNIFIDNDRSIISFDGRGLIVSNTFIGNDHAMWLYGGVGISFIKNVITNTSSEAIHGEFVDSLFIENNVFAGNRYYAIVLDNFTGKFMNVPIRNNTLIGESNHAVVIIEAFNNEIRNNIICGGYCGIVASGYCYYVGGVPWECHSGNPQVSYNNLWGNVLNYWAPAGSIDTSLGGNIYLDPMFVGYDDYHLQYASPCIDAGDPNIKDPDSSRSDIGCYGGTWGETYSYQDYPPKAPDSLSAISESTVIILSWKPNTESDLSHYLVYRDTITWFAPDTSKIVGIITKDSSTFRDYDFVLGKTYYYRLTAWDTTGHKSAYSDELEVVATSVSEYTEEENRPPMYQLSQNYPNPFNSSTVIWYYLPDVGYQPAEVEITIYNILGRKVRTLVHERKYPGRHMATWDGKDNSDNDLASGIYFYKLKFSGVDLSLFIKPKKMTLIR